MTRLIDCVCEEHHLLLNYSFNEDLSPFLDPGPSNQVAAARLGTTFLFHSVSYQLGTRRIFQQVLANCWHTSSSSWDSEYLMRSAFLVTRCTRHCSGWMVSPIPLVWATRESRAIGFMVWRDSFRATTTASVFIIPVDQTIKSHVHWELILYCLKWPNIVPLNSWGAERLVQLNRGSCVGAGMLGKWSTTVMIWNLLVITAMMMARSRRWGWGLILSVSPVPPMCWCWRQRQICRTGMTGNTSTKLPINWSNMICQTPQGWGWCPSATPAGWRPPWPPSEDREDIWRTLFQTSID